MKFALGTSLTLGFAAASALASPLVKLQGRQQQQDPDDAVLYSPANLTQLNPGATFNFTYLCDDDDTDIVRVALIQYIEIAANVSTTRTAGGNRIATAQLTIPADLAAGSYVIGVDEIDNDDNDDDNDDNDDSRDAYDYDIKFESPNDIDGPERPFIISVGNASV